MSHTNHTSDPTHLDTYGGSRTGHGRSLNGDQFVVADLKRAARVHHASRPELEDGRRFGDSQAHVLVVADGAGSPRESRRTSRLVVDEVMESILNAVPWSPELDVNAEANLRQHLRETVIRCNRELTRAASSPGADPSSSTGPAAADSALTMAFVRWPIAFVVHAGDSRAYLVRQGEIEQLTTDHSKAQQVADRGAPTSHDVEAAEFAHLLWNAVGGDSRVQPKLTMKRLRAGDTVMVCTDGVTEALSDDEIRAAIDTHGSAESAGEAMLDTVARRRGRDDATLTLTRFVDETPAAASAQPGPSHFDAQAAKPEPRPTLDPTPNPTVRRAAASAV